MDRTVVIPLSAPIPREHRIEVIEVLGESGSPSVIAIADLDEGVRFERSDPQPGEVSSWMGTVLACTVSAASGRVRTTLTVDPGRPGAADADVALRGADAAAEAAKAEADRWGGADTVVEPEPPRFW